MANDLIAIRIGRACGGPGLSASGGPYGMGTIGSKIVAQVRTCGNEPIIAGNDKIIGNRVLIDKLSRAGRNSVHCLETGTGICTSVARRRALSVPGGMACDCTNRGCISEGGFEFL